MIIGLTGSIGTGKSTILNIFKKNNFLTFNSDECVAELINSNLEVIAKIKQYFPTCVFNNKVNKDILKKTIYSNYVDNIKILENIVVPYVVVSIKDFIKNNINKSIIIEASLYFEYNINTMCNYTIATFCHKKTQILRVQNRNGLSKSVIIKIIKKQVKVKEYKNKINLFVNTENSFKEVEEVINKFIQTIN